MTYRANPKQGPLVAKSAAAGNAHCGVCGRDGAIYKHAYQGGGAWSCPHCHATSHLSRASRFSLVMVRFVIMFAAAFACLFGTAWVLETYAPNWEPPYGLHIVPLLVFSAIYVLLIERFIVRQFKYDWQRSAS